MKTLVLIVLVAAVWLIVGYNYTHESKTAAAQTAAAAETPEPDGATRAARRPAATPVPEQPIDQHEELTGPYVLFFGRLSQKLPNGEFLIRCEKTYTAKDGQPALNHPWHSALTACEIDGEFLLLREPGVSDHVDQDRLGGIGQLGAPYSFISPFGEKRTVRKLYWVDPKTVANYQPPGATPTAAEAAKADKGKLIGSALDQKPGKGHK